MAAAITGVAPQKKVPGGAKSAYPIVTDKARVTRNPR